MVSRAYSLPLIATLLPCLDRAVGSGDAEVFGQVGSAYALVHGGRIVGILPKDLAAVWATSALGSFSSFVNSGTVFDQSRMFCDRLRLFRRPACSERRGPL